MKNLILFAIFFNLFQISNAQTNEINSKDLGLKGHVKQIAEYTYSGKPNETEIDTFGKSYKTITDFDKDGNKLKEVKFNKSGFVMYQSLFDYTEKSKINVSEFDGANNLLSRYIYKLDTKANIIEIDKYRMGVDSPIFRTIYNYNINNNHVSSITQFNSRFLVGKDTILYNEKNEKIEDDTYVTMRKYALASKTYYKYDVLGNVTETEYVSLINKDGTTTSTIYKSRDKYNNWIVSISTDNSSSQLLGDFINKKITKRVIRYF